MDSALDHTAAGSGEVDTGSPQAVAAAVGPPPLIDQPTVSFATLAKIMGASSPLALIRMLRGHKVRAQGPRRSYQVAVKQAVDALVHNVPLDPSAPMRKHEREAIEALVVHPPRLPAWVRATRPPRRAAWEVNGVRVSMNPDVILESSEESGAAKFSFTKAPLAPGVGPTMAELLWYFLDRVEQRRHVHPECCIIFEPRVGRTHAARVKPKRLIKSLDVATAAIRALWPIA